MLAPGLVHHQSVYELLFLLLRQARRLQVAAVATEIIRRNHCLHPADQAGGTPLSGPPEEKPDMFLRRVGEDVREQKVDPSAVFESPNLFSFL